MENIIDLKLNCLYKGIGFDYQFNVQNFKKYAVIATLCNESVKARFTWKEEVYTFIVDFKDKTIKKENSSIPWEDNKYLSDSTKDITREIFEGFYENIISYMQTLYNNDCKELFKIYKLAVTNSNYHLVESCFKGTRYAFIQLMDTLKILLEDNIEDNYIKLYNYLVYTEFRTIDENRVSIANSIFMDIYKKEYTEECIGEYENKRKTRYIDLIPLYPTKSLIRLSHIKKQGNLFYNSEGIILAPKEKVEEDLVVLTCIIRDINGNKLFNFDFTPILHI